MVVKSETGEGVQAEGWKRNRCFFDRIKAVLRYALLVAGISFAAALFSGASGLVLFLGVFVFLLVFIPAMLGIYALGYLGPSGDRATAWYWLTVDGVWFSRRPPARDLFVSPKNVISASFDEPNRFVFLVSTAGGENKILFCPAEEDVQTVKSLFKNVIG